MSLSRFSFLGLQGFIQGGDRETYSLVVSRFERHRSSQHPHRRCCLRDDAIPFRGLGATGTTTRFNYRCGQCLAKFCGKRSNLGFAHWYFYRMVLSRDFSYLTPNPYWENPIDPRPLRRKLLVVFPLFGLVYLKCNLYASDLV